MCIKTKKLALKIIMWISVAGMAFSGYLSYTELFQKVCALGGGCTSIIGLPSCVYGFVMYAIVFVISLFGLKAKK
jgi:hypothetical protein